MYKGELEGFPTEVVEWMLYQQEKQGNRRDVSVFEIAKRSGKWTRGFDWDGTNEGEDFCQEVIEEKNFGLFFQHYPKINTMTPEQKQSIIEAARLNPEKESELRELFPEAFESEWPLDGWNGKVKIDRWIIGDQYTSKLPNITVRKDERDHFYLNLHGNFNWEIIDGYRLYAKPKL